MKKSICLFFILLAYPLIGQNYYELKIVLKQENDNQKIISEGEVTISPIDKTFKVNKLGWINIALPANYYQFIVRSPGFKDYSFEMIVDKDTIIHVFLPDKITILEEVEISSSLMEERMDSPLMSIETITPQLVNDLPVISGERDLLKAAGFMPGIQSGSEGSADLLVRGGTTDQNLYLLDNATLYHSNHLYGFLSSFNPTMVSSLDVYKGGFPARFGNRLSSIIDARTIEPVFNDHSGEFNVGLLSSSAYINGPVIKDKLNIIASGRRSYFDGIIKIFEDPNDHEIYNFYDANIKFSYKTNKEHQFALSFYGDRDFYQEIDQKREVNDFYKLNRTWKNQIINFSYKGRLGKLTNLLNIYSSKFSTRITENVDYLDINYENVFSNSIQDYTLKYKLNYELIPKLNFYLGTELTELSVIGANNKIINDSSSLVINKIPQDKSKNLSFYIGTNGSIKNKLKFEAGIRNSNFYNNEENILMLEPRISAAYVLDQNNTIKIGHSKMSQYLHLLTNPGLGMPINIYINSNNNLKVSSSNIFSIGYLTKRRFYEHNILFNIEAYYKTLDNIITYKDGFSSHIFTSSFRLNDINLSDVLTQGTGRSYGLEFFMQKNAGDLRGTLSYTLSWTRNKFSELNNGNYFPARHDRRHNLNLLISYKINKKWNLNASWSYLTGEAITIPYQMYYAPEFNFTEGKIKPYDPIVTILYSQSERNAFRMKDFHTLNISTSKDFNITKKLLGTFELGIYNSYNRKNPFYYYIDIIHKGESIANNPKIKNIIKSVSIFPILPYFTFKFRFK